MGIKDISQFLGWDVILPFILGVKKNKLYRFTNSYVGKQYIRGGLLVEANKPVEI